MSEPKPTDSEEYILSLYVAGQTAKSLAAFSNLKKICEAHLSGRYTIEIIDVLLHPEIAIQQQIFALPTLIRKVPEPIRKIIGDLSDTEKSLIAMDIRPRLAQ